MVSAGTKRPTHRILLLEKDAEDAERVESALREAGLSFLSKRVDTRDAFVRELSTFTPDAVLSDYALSGWSALDALRRVEEAGRHVAFILVTRPQSEAIAVECLKAGADDYVSKSDLSRLPSVLRDAVHKKEAERERAASQGALQRTEERFRILTQYASDLICLLDGEGRFLYASPSFEEHLGHPPAELVGTRADALVHPEDLEKIRTAMQADAQAVEGRPAQFRCRRRDGEWRIVEAVGEKVPGRNGGSEGAVVVARDVTERARLEEELHEAQRMEAIRRLAGGIAHDFNNLLTAIKGHTEIVLDILVEGDPLRPNLEEVKRAADRAAALTRQLVAFSRRQVVSFEEVDVNAIVSRMQRTIRRLLGDGIELRTALAPDLDRVRADPHQIEQVIQNLVTNAREAMPQGGTLRIETANADLDAKEARRHVGVIAGAYVVIAVQDTGRGIDAGTRSTIFEPFFTTKSLGEGNGLGLSVVYGIVKQSGGAIGVEGEPGEGTTFRIYLPRVTE
ncbi:MAG: PAS domain S-box protein, partial [Gemmatimonadota bacterium]